MLIFVTGLLLCMKFVVQMFSLQIMWHLMLFLFLFTPYYKIPAEQIYSICCSVTDQQHWNILQGLEWTFVMNKHCQTIPSLNVICSVSLETLLLFAWCVCFEWFGNVSPEMNWSERRAHYRLQSTRSPTLPCGIPLFFNVHQPTPSKKEPKCSQ